MSLEIEPTVADQMDPGNPDNSPDESGRGVKWDPAAVLAAAEATANLNKEENDD